MASKHNTSQLLRRRHVNEGRLSCSDGAPQAARTPLIKADVVDGKVRTVVECEPSQVASLGLGVSSAEYAEYLMCQILNLTVSGELPDGPLDMRDANGLLKLAASLAPETDYEAAVAVQMAMLHHVALDCARRAMSRGATIEGRALNIAHAGKLSRSYATLLEALSRSRGKTPQVVRVEHVTINGGQAIVGSVAGGASKSRGSTP